MTLRVTVKRLWDETPEIRCFELQPADGGTLPLVEPGAHIDVHLCEDLVRQYSLCNGPEETDSYFIGVKREPQSRGGSAAMHGLVEGQLLTISEPRNNFPLANFSDPSLLLAGGIGITPLLSMARHLKALNRPAQLHLFARSMVLSPFFALLEKDPDATIHTGLVPPELNEILARLLTGRPDDAHLYICGPGPFMDLVRQLAAETNWPDSHVHLEYFSADKSLLELCGEAFELVLERSGRTLVVKSDQTIIQAMEEAGVNILTSCEQGVCGTCVTTVIEGQPDHRDLYFNAEERASGKLITPCVSRCKGKRLVLDL